MKSSYLGIHLQYNMTRVSVVTPSIDRKSEEPPVSPGTRDQSDDDSGVFERRDGAQNSKREGASKLDGAFSTDNAQHKQRTKEQVYFLIRGMIRRSHLHAADL